MAMSTERQVADKIAGNTHKLTVYIPDTRGVTVSRYGRGNLKIGESVYTYSRLPGMVGQFALGIAGDDRARHLGTFGTCPGATEECQQICYARRPVQEHGPVYDMWCTNSLTEEVPPIPDDCMLLRIHVSGDFTSNQYIRAWIKRLTERPDVQAWAYTRSWRCPELLGMLELLRALPNMQLFASMDASTVELPPVGWRVAWIDGDDRLQCSGRNRNVSRLRSYDPVRRTISIVAEPAYVCPEETGHRRDCVECGYCFKGQKHDVIFLPHGT